MAESLHLPLHMRPRRVPASIEASLRARYLAVMADLAAHYGVSQVTLILDGQHVRLEGPRGGVHADAPKAVMPAQPMPPVTDPRWYAWTAQAALWAHRARGCRGCGKRGKSLRLNRQGQCPSCRAEDAVNAQRRQIGLGFDDIEAKVERVSVQGRAA